MNVRFIMVMASLATFGFLSGCNKPIAPTGMKGEPGKVEDLVFQTTQVWNEKENFASLFAESAKLSDKERKKFEGTSIRPDQVQIEGDAAIIEVVVTTYPNQEAKDTAVTWEATKEGDSWKITKAPLQ